MKVLRDASRTHINHIHALFPLRPPRNLLPPQSRFHRSASAAAHKPPRRQRAAPTSGPRPRPPAAVRRARAPQPSSRAPGHGPALPPPRPNRTPVRERPGRCRHGRPAPACPRPTRPPPGRRPVPASRLTGSPRDHVRCPYPAPVPSSSSSNRPTPPAHPRDDLTRTPPVTRRRKGSSSPAAPFIERD